MPNITTVNLTAGVPTGPAGASTVSTIDALMADGGQATIGAKADAKASTSDATPISGISIWKQISFSIQAAAASLAGTLTVASHAVTNAGTFAVQATLTAGSLLLGKVGIDQTTPGTTNLVALTAETTKVIGVAKIGDGTNTATVKAASTAPVATDPALVVAISPNSVNANSRAAAASSAPVVLSNEDQTTLQGIAAAKTTGGATGAKAFSAASTNATSLKGSAGTLYGVVAINTTTTVYYLKLYDKATAPTVGTDVPIQTYPVAASATGAGEVIPFPVGLAFTIGIAWALTAAAADADTGVAATGVTINFQYK